MEEKEKSTIDKWESRLSKGSIIAALVGAVCAVGKSWIAGRKNKMW